MTCIIGVEDGERAYVIADSGCWRGQHSRAAMASPAKIWRSGQWVIAAAGAFTSIGLARDTALPEVDLRFPEQAEPLLFDWALRFQKRLGELQTVLMAADKDHTGDSPSFVVALGSRVWGVDRCAVTRYQHGFRTAGCREFLTPCMHALASVAGPNPLARAQQTMRLANQHTDWAMAPFLWMCTDGSEGSFE